MARRRRVRPSVKRHQAFRERGNYRREVRPCAPEAFIVAKVLSEGVGREIDIASAR